MRGSSSQWSFSNTANQLLSFKSAQEQGGGIHRLNSQQLLQRMDKQGGSHHPITSHHWPHNDVQPVNYPSDGRVFPSTGQISQMVPTRFNSSILASHLSTNASHLVTSALGSASAMSAGTVKPSNGPVVGSTDLRSSPSISSGPCQLTIFYNGSVCVYDNVSPDKAQAIMLLAGNGDSTKSSPITAAPSSIANIQTPVSRLPPNDSAVATQQSIRLSGHDNTILNQRPVLRPASNDTLVANKTLQSDDTDMADQSAPMRTQVKDIALSNQSLGLSISTAVPTPRSSAPVVASTSVTEVNAVKPVVAPLQIKCSEPMKTNTAVGAGALKLIPSAVPQARKASLARFLEKRKERVISVSPYVVSKNSSECSTVGAGSVIPVNSPSGSPLPATG